MDACQIWEINDIVENLPYLDRMSWEQTRLLAYIGAQTHSTKKLDITDIIQFKWDEKQQKNIEISNSDIQRLKNKSEMLQKMMKEKKLKIKYIDSV